MKIKILLIPTLFCLGCASTRNFTKQEVIQYVKEHYTSKEELTPKTLITFKTLNFDKEDAKNEIIFLAYYGYGIDLDSSLYGEKRLNTKKEFIDFYGDSFLPINEKTINNFPSETTYQLKGDELEIKSVEVDKTNRDEKTFNYQNNGYEKQRIESFSRTKTNYSFKVVVTSTYTY